MEAASYHATACIGCRRRGRKCDRTLPKCLSCEKRGVACEGYVTKWPGVAARGKLAGRSIPVADSSVIIAGTHSRARQRRLKRDTSTTPTTSSTVNPVPSDEVDKFIQYCTFSNTSDWSCLLMPAVQISRTSVLFSSLEMDRAKTPCFTMFFL